MSAADSNRSIEAIWRIEQPKLIAGLVRMVRDVALAEDLAQDALVAALKTWPETGPPDRPGAWLMAAAKRRAIDLLRRDQMLARKHAALQHELEEEEKVAPDFDSALDDEFGDDMLRLMFVSCHTLLSPEARVALTLRLVGGLTTEEIAHAFLVPEPTIAQRIVRAKKTLAESGAAFEVPQGEERAARLASVMEAIYLVFNEGYSASAGEHWMRPQLCEEALRLGRILAELAPLEPEAHGLVALMEIQASRFHARTDASGAPVLLMDQDRSRWDLLLIRRGLDALARGEARLRELGEAPGPYWLQAAIAACHARARTADETDWARIVALYDLLLVVTPTPIVALNRAVALSMADGPAAGLEALELLADAPQLKGYHLLPAVRGDFLMKLGRKDEARAEFERAASLTKNDRERIMLLERAAKCATQN